jgi:Ca2+-binding RTX toxin-like protein
VLFRSLYIDLAASFTSSVSFRLPANVENLNAEKIIANLQDMLLNISLVGNSLDNTIVGNAGRNRIDGGDGNDKLQGGLGNDTLDGGNGSDILQGGPGNDKLTGGEGGDSFQFESTPDNFNASSSASYKNVDHIVDFISGTDRIQLKQSLFSAAGTAGSVLSDSEFVATATPSKIAAQHIIYDTATGNLFYNSDGIGTAELVLIGVLDGQPALGAADISFI